MNIQFRRGQEASRAGITPKSGEPLYTTDTKKLYVGDGSTPGGVEISSSGGGGAVDSVNGQVGVVVLTKSDVGLSNVPNTDLTADVAANTAKNSYPSGDASKLAGIAAGAQVNTVTSVAGKTGSVTVTKSDVGLSSVPNTDFTSAVAANTAKVGITPTQASNITTNNAKVSFDATSSSRLANTSGTNTGDQVVPAQFAPVAGANVTLTGTYPNITFSASGGGGGGGGDMYKVDNLSGLANTATARTNIGLGSVPNTDFTSAVAANTAKISYTDGTKVAGIATGATANDTDANLKNRANHTGVQAQSTVTSLVSDLAGKANTVHTHVATTDLTATGTKSSATYLRGDNTWNTPTNTTYTEITSAEITTGTASTARTISGRRAQEIVDKAVAASTALLNTSWLTLLPVGATWYGGLNSANPSTYLPGHGSTTWVANSEGRVIAGKAPSGTFNTAGGTMGVESVTLTSAQSGVPPHTHPFAIHSPAIANGTVPGGTNGGLWANGTATANTAQDAASSHTNVQPTQVEYIWKRTA